MNERTAGGLMTDTELDLIEQILRTALTEAWDRLRAR